MATVRMIHPSFPDREPIEVDERAFDNTWEGKGWELVNPFDSLEVGEVEKKSGEEDEDGEGEEGNGTDITEFTSSAPTLETLPRADLLTLAESLGIETEHLEDEQIRDLISDNPDFYRAP